MYILLLHDPSVCVLMYGQAAELQWVVILSSGEPDWGQLILLNLINGNEIKICQLLILVYVVVSSSRYHGRRLYVLVFLKLLYADFR